MEPKILDVSGQVNDIYMKYLQNSETQYDIKMSFQTSQLIDIEIIISKPEAEFPAINKLLKNRGCGVDQRAAVRRPEFDSRLGTPGEALY
jgi:hypothetical protein